jgi:hypothetical protein
MYPRNRRLAVILPCVIAISCAGFRTRSFLVVPQSPNYLLRTPDSEEIPFPDVLRTYNGFEPARSWMDLRPLMQLRIENAYYKPGMPRQGLAGFLGTELAEYEVSSHGLRLLSVQPMKGRPEGDLPVDRLISPVQAGYRYHRFYFEIFFKNENNSHGSALLGANSADELDRLSAGLVRPETVCNQNSNQCTVFPEACSVSINMKIFVNGKPQTVLWRTTLSDIIRGRPEQIDLKRLYAGRLTPVHLNPQDRDELKLPLLPGDHVSWN